MKSTVRTVPRRHLACPECDEIVALAISKPGAPLRVHGPRNARCPGGGGPGRSWLESTGLPSWSEMTDVDRGCALLFRWKVEWERSYIYARDNYPAVYRDSPVLRALDRFDSCRHATAVVRESGLTSRDEEWQRLYDLAMASPTPEETKP